MKIYVYESVARNSGESGRAMMNEDRISVQYPRALGLAVGDKLYLTEEEEGYTEYQNFSSSIKRIS